MAYNGFLINADAMHRCSGNVFSVLRSEVVKGLRKDARVGSLYDWFAQRGGFRLHLMAADGMAVPDHFRSSLESTVGEMCETARRQKEEKATRKKKNDSVAVVAPSPPSPPPPPPAPSPPSAAAAVDLVKKPRKARRTPLVVEAAPAAAAVETVVDLPQPARKRRRKADKELAAVG